jgi:hypothetical protein
MFLTCHVFNQWLALHITENPPAKFIMQALELAPTKLHDRSPVFLGSYDDRGTNSKA